MRRGIDRSCRPWKTSTACASIPSWRRSLPAPPRPHRRRSSRLRDGTPATCYTCGFGDSMRNAIALVLAGVASLVVASTPVYDEAADAKAQIHAALGEAQRANLPVLVVFGANWCGDCKVLDTAFNSGTSASLIAKKYQLVHVNVGRFDRNV